MVYLRDTDFITLDDLQEKVVDRRLYAAAASVDVRVKLEVDHAHDADPAQDPQDRPRGTITVGKRDIPATTRGLLTLASFYDVPTKFFERISVEEQQFILDHRIQRSPDVPLVLRYTDGGIDEAYVNGAKRIQVEDLVDALGQHMPGESRVTDWHNSPAEFYADVVVPEGFDRFIGGDRKVGDLTQGGVRVGQNRAQNLAPWVQTFLYRLVCTNGMEVPDTSLRVDARGAEESEIISMFASEAKRALDHSTARINEFYALREETVDSDRTGYFRKMVRDFGVNDRMTGRMEDTLADALLAEEEVTLFHLVNHLTNEANRPGTRRNAQRDLQRAGGTAVVDHAARCNLCHSRVGQN